MEVAYLDKRRFELLRVSNEIHKDLGEQRVKNFTVRQTTVRTTYLRDEILQLGMFLSTSLEMGRQGIDLGNFLSILPLTLGTITGGGFLVGGGDMVRVRGSQSLVESFRPFGETVPRYLARPPLFLCTVDGLRNSDELFATSTDIASLFFLICVEKYRTLSNVTGVAPPGSRFAIRYLGLLRLDLSLEVLGDLPLGLVVTVTGVGLAVGGGLGGSPETRVRGPGPREGASLGLALEPLVGRARGGGQRRGPGPLGPGNDLRGRRQLG